MHNPPHPGEILRAMYLAPLDLTVTATAEGLGVTRKALSELVNGHTDISRDMAIRLAKAFPNTDIRFWLDLQVQSRYLAGGTAIHRHHGQTVRAPVTRVQFVPRLTSTRQIEQS